MSIKRRSSSLHATKEVISFSEEDMDLIFNTLSSTSFNNCITANSLSNAYSGQPPPTTTTSIPSPSPKYDQGKLLQGIENSVKELLPEIESDSIREKIVQNGINKKQFKKLVKRFQEVINTTIDIKERDELLHDLEKECILICEEDPKKFVQMLHLSTIIEPDDLAPLFQKILEKDK